MSYFFYYESTDIAGINGPKSIFTDLLVAFTNLGKAITILISVGDYQSIGDDYYSAAMSFKESRIYIHDKIDK